MKRLRSSIPANIRHTVKPSSFLLLPILEARTQQIFVSAHVNEPVCPHLNGLAWIGTFKYSIYSPLAKAQWELHWGLTQGLCQISGADTRAHRPVWENHGVSGCWDSWRCLWVWRVHWLPFQWAEWSQEGCGGQDLDSFWCCSSPMVPAEAVTMFIHVTSPLWL